MKTSVQIVLAAVLFCGLTQREVSATPQPAPPPGGFETLAEHLEGSSKYKSHRLWGSILKTLYGDEDSYGNQELDYSRLDTAGREVLDSYLKTLQATNILVMSRDEQLAYWLNFYNAASLAFTLNEFTRINRRYTNMVGRNPLRKPRIKVKRFYLDDDSPWTQKLFTVHDVPLSLNDIEHNILYAFWDNPYVMYGLSCPAKGCPAFPRVPYNGVEVHSQLQAAARRFVAEKHNLDVKRGNAEVSQLYEWHLERFGGEAGVITHLQKIGGPAAAGITGIEDYDFEWDLAGKAPDPGWNNPTGPINRGASPIGGVQ